MADELQTLRNINATRNLSTVNPPNPQIPPTTTPPIPPNHNIFVCRHTLAWLIPQGVFALFAVGAFLNTKYLGDFKTSMNISNLTANAIVAALLVAISGIMFILRMFMMGRHLRPWYGQGGSSGLFLALAYLLADEKHFERSGASLIFFVLLSLSLMSYLESFVARVSTGFFGACAGFAIGLSFEVFKGHSWVGWSLVVGYSVMFSFKFYCDALESEGEEAHRQVPPP